VCKLCIIPHSLPDAEKATRVQIAIELKKVLLSAKHRGWRYILTGNESWFYFNINHDKIWIQETDLLPTRVRQTISSPKRMPTTFWSHSGLLSFNCFLNRIILMQIISVIRSFNRSTEFVRPKQPKMQSDDSSCIPIMPARIR
jgi:hypothetical protein